MPPNPDLTLTAALEAWARHPVELVVGFAFGVLGGGPAVAWTLYLLRGSRSRGGIRYTAEMGLIERTVFWLAVLLGRAEVAVAWVALRVVARWGGRQQTSSTSDLFLVGLGLSLMYAAGGAVLVVATAHAEWPLAAASIAAPLMLSAGVLLIRRGPVRLRRVVDPEAEREGEEPGATAGTAGTPR